MQPLTDKEGEVRELTAEDFAKMRPAAEIMPEVVAAHHIQQSQRAIDTLQTRYGMTYEQFETYLQHHADKLMRTPNRELNQAIMREEDDAMDWKMARDVLATLEKI